MQLPNHGLGRGARRGACYEQFLAQPRNDHGPPRSSAVHQAARRECKHRSPERSEAKLTVRTELCNRRGVLHGGAVMALGDTRRDDGEH